MFVDSIEIEGFGCFVQRARLTLHEGLTTFVGENSTGKSTISLALQRLIAHGTGSNAVTTDDFSYGSAQKLTIAATVVLPDDELESRVLGTMTHEIQAEHVDSVRQWLRERGNALTLSLTQPGQQLPDIIWGDLEIRDREISIGGLGAEKPRGSWQGFVGDLARQGVSLSAGMSDRVGQMLAAPVGPVATLLQSRLRVLHEFRGRSLFDKRTGATESMSGEDTASALFNLKNHADPLHRARYREIVDTFHSLFPRYQIEAVETSPGAGTAEIQFTEIHRTKPISVSRISAGVHQSLTLIVNLVGREGMILFVEHPEQHLHPHGMRFIQKLMKQSAEKNQIIVATHDPNFVDASEPLSLRRFSWVPGTGVLIHEPRDNDLNEIQQAQLGTTLRHLDDRQVVFARGAILVEDDSQRDFLIEVAPTLGYDLDAIGLSIVSVGGETGYKPFFVLLESLAIPYSALKDRHWGDSSRYPSSRFFSFGCELEDFLDTEGLKSVREDVIKRVGTSKPRVAQQLGAILRRDQVPAIFTELLKAASGLVEGGPEGS